MRALSATREEAISFLMKTHPSRVAVLERTFELLDDTVDAFEAAEGAGTYSRVCGLALLKATQLGKGSLSLVLDGLGQESGALLRPMIEYVELMTYFRLNPKMTDRAIENDLPKAGKRAQEIGGIFKNFREHLNTEASHSSFSHYAMAHLLDSTTMRFRKRQAMVPHVLEKNVRDLVIQLHNLLYEAMLTLRQADEVAFEILGTRYDRLKTRMFDVYGLN